MSSSRVPERAPGPDEAGAEIFASSRWTAGNLLFPDRLLVTPRALLYRKRTWISSREEEIPWHKIASVSVARGLFFATLIVETTGGSRPIVVNGLRGAKADRARHVIAEWQGRGARRAPEPWVENGRGAPDPALEARFSRQTALLEEMVRLQREVLEELRRR